MNAAARQEPAPESRPTVSAPARSVAPSQRPTAVPEHSDSCVVATFEIPAAQPVPRDFAVPTRVRGAKVTGAVGVRAAFVLMHVDGFATVSEIATHTQLPLGAVCEALATLLDSGAVELEGDAPRATSSGIFSR